MSTLTFKAERSTHKSEPKPWRVASQLTPTPGKPVSTHSYWSEIVGYFDTGIQARAFIRARQRQATPADQ